MAEKTRAQVKTSLETDKPITEPKINDLADSVYFKEDGKVIVSHSVNVATKVFTLTTSDNKTSTVNFGGETPVGDIVLRSELLDEGINRYDKKSADNNNAGFLDTNNNPVSHATATHSRYFPLEEGKSYWYLGAYGASTFMVIVDAAYNKVRSVSGSVDGSFIAAPTEAYARFSIRSKDTFLFAEGNVIGEYEAFLKRIKPDIANPDDYRNTGIVLFGDSITEQPSSWPVPFKARVNPMYVENFARSGQKLAWRAGTIETDNPPNNGHDNNVLWNSIKKWEATSPLVPHAIIIAIGTNDISQGSPIGSFVDAFAQDEASTDHMTAANAYRKAINYLLTNYPKTQIFYCTPTQSRTGGRNYGTITNVGNVISEISKRMGVKIFDVTNECGIVDEFENEGAAGRYLYDGTHLTSPESTPSSETGVDYGSVMQGRYIAQKFKEQFELRVE